MVSVLFFGCGVLLAVCVQVSQISGIFESLLDEEKKCLKENPVTSVKWDEVVLNVNNIIKVRLCCAHLDPLTPSAPAAGTGVVLGCHLQKLAHP